MERKLDQIIVVDIEATCWDGDPPAGETSDIIEIGVCPLVVATGERLEPRSILVRPERSRVSDYCTQLTTLTQADVDTGVAFAEACEILSTDFETPKRVWASFGDFDRERFAEQCAASGAAYPFWSRHLNVKTLFAVRNALRREVGVAKALKMLQLPLEGTHHRGVDDAWNIAGILGCLLDKDAMVRSQHRR